MVYSLALNRVIILSNNNTITAIDCNASQGAVTYSGIKDLGCEKTLSSAALSSTSVSNTLWDIAEPLVPALSESYVPVVTGVGVGVVCECRPTVWVW